MAEFVDFGESWNESHVSASGHGDSTSLVYVWRVEDSQGRVAYAAFAVDPILEEAHALHLVNETGRDYFLEANWRGNSTRSHNLVAGSSVTFPIPNGIRKWIEVGDGTRDIDFEGLVVS